MKGIRKMDEMELQITLRASRAAWFFLVLALVVGVGGISRRGHYPARLPAGGPGNDFLPGAVDRPGQSGGRPGKAGICTVGYSHCGPGGIFIAAGSGRMKNRVKELRKARGLPAGGRSRPAGGEPPDRQRRRKRQVRPHPGLGYEAGPPAGDSGGRAVYPRGLRTPPEPIRFGGRSRTVTI